MSAKAVRKAEAHSDQLTTVLDNAIVVFQHLIDLESVIFYIPQLPAAGEIGIQIVDIVKVRRKTCFDVRK